MTDKNLQNFKGENSQKKITITDDDGEKINLTTGTVSEVYLTFSTGLHRYGEIQFEKTPISINNQSTAIFEITKGDTENLRPGNYIYEIWLEYNDGKVYTAEVGKYFLKPRVES